MKFFLKRSILFLVPIFVVGIFPISVFLLSGELLTPKMVVRLQKDKVFLYLPAYGNFVKEYKAEAIRMRNPEIIALGTSRVTELKSDLFKNLNIFYNAGGAISSIGDLRKFKNSLGQAKPKIFIIALDSDFFDPNFSDRLLLAGYGNKNTHTTDVFREGFVKVYSDYFSNKFSIKNILSCFKNNRIGLNACVENQGYRPDGSYKNSEKVIQDSTRSILDKVKRLKSGEQVFAFNGDISEKAIVELDLFLTECKKDGIDVIGYITPYAPAVFRVLPKNISDSLNVDLPESVGEIFKKYGFSFLGGQTIQSSLKDEDMIDAYHVNEETGSMILFQLNKISLILPLKKLEN